MSAAADWHAATRIAAPRYDVAALTAWFARVDPAPLIRSGMPMIPAPTWDRGALSALFGLDNPNHCFHVAPHRWATFHEPQITGGFAHFLNSGDHRQRLARAVAFVKATATCAGADPKFIDDFDATFARCVAEENRTDLLVELRRGEQRIGAAVEAKFGHLLTTGQLPKAEQTITDLGAKPEDFIRLIVAPDPLHVDKFILRDEGENWTTMSWSGLLGSLERHIAPGTADCADYRRFRRTVWHRAY